MFVKGTVPSCQWKGAYPGRKPDIWECHFSQPRAATCPGCCRCGGTTLSPWLPLWADTGPNCCWCTWLKQQTERGSARWASSSWPCWSQCLATAASGHATSKLPGLAARICIWTDDFERHQKKHQEDVPLDGVRTGMNRGDIVEAKPPALNTVPHMGGTTDRHLQALTQPPEWVQRAGGRQDLISYLQATGLVCWGRAEHSPNQRLLWGSGL